MIKLISFVHLLFIRSSPMSIEVHVRVRPTAPSVEVGWAVTDTVLCSTTQQDLRYQFSRVYNSATTNSTIFHGVDPLIHRGFHGEHVTIMAYGQTGSGKTHSMMGTGQDAGIIRRTAQLLCNLRAHHPNTSVSASCIEIYNETVRDLINDCAEVQLRGEDGVESAMQAINSIGDFETMVASTESRRQYKATDQNEHSSRSHTILTFHVSHSGRVKSTISLVDLAGSESAAKANTEGSAQREGGFINKSLLILGNVVDGIVSKQKHISYRSSKLTRILQRCLSGNGITFILCCVNPALTCREQSVSALNFTQRAMKIKKDPTVTITMAPPIVEKFGAAALQLISQMDDEEQLAAQVAFQEVYQRNRRTVARIVAQRKGEEASTVAALGELQAQLLLKEHGVAVKRARLQAEEAIRADKMTAELSRSIQNHLARGRDVGSKLDEAARKKRRAEELYSSRKAESDDVKRQWAESLQGRENAPLIALMEEHTVGHLELRMESLWVWEKLWEAKRLAVQQELDRQICDEEGRPLLLCAAKAIPAKCKELIASLQAETESIAGALSLLSDAQGEEVAAPQDTSELKAVRRAISVLRETRALAIQQRVGSPSKRAPRPVSPGASPGATRLQSTVNLLHNTRSKLDNTQCLIASPDDPSRLLGRH